MSIKRNPEDLGPMIHPGEMLREEFMKPMGISIKQMAADLAVPVTRISQIVNERRGISPDTALRLGRYFGTSFEIWMNLQTSYELKLAQQAAGKEIKRLVHPRRKNKVAA